MTASRTSNCSAHSGFIFDDPAIAAACFPISIDFFLSNLIVFDSFDITALFLFSNLFSSSAEYTEEMESNIYSFSSFF